MATSALNKKITNAAPYPIPAGKYAIFTANFISGSGTGQRKAELSIGGVNVATLMDSGSSGQAANYFSKPHRADAGDVISVAAGQEIGISGILVDA